VARSARGVAAVAAITSPASAQQKQPNIVMLMTDDTGWNDFGAYSGGGAGLGHPTPNIDRIAKEGAVFTNWYGQASCTAEFFKKNGYSTYFSGKWHLGDKPDAYPTEHGFDWPL
jgi:arylsulfatase A-like enzyme